MPADTRQLGMPTAAPDAAPSWRLIDLLPGRTTLVSAASVIAVLLLWQASGSLGWVDPLILPPPTELWQTLTELITDGYRQTAL